MHLDEAEHINPFAAQNPNFWMKIEHLARYLFAAEFLPRRQCRGAHLDVGCADGYGLSELAAALPGPLVGIDYDPALVALARQAVPTAQVTEMDLDAAPDFAALAAAPFASVTAFEVLEHVNDPAAVLDSVAQKMLKGGWLLASLPNPAFEQVDAAGTPVSPHHHHSFDRAAATALFEDAGFRVEDILGQGLSNRLFSRERNLASAGVLPGKPFAAPYFQEPAMVRQFAHLLAWPHRHELEKSYSFIYLCQRR